MFNKDKYASDAFTLSLGGVTTVNSFAAAPAIAHDRLRQVEFDRDQQDSPEASPFSCGRFWLWPA